MVIVGGGGVGGFFFGWGRGSFFFGVFFASIEIWDQRAGCGGMGVTPSASQTFRPLPKVAFIKPEHVMA